MNFEQTFKEFIEDLPVELAIIVENYTIDVFDNESFDGVKWQPRQDNDTSRALLVGHGGGANLRNSIRFEIEGDAVHIKTDVPYAEIHNEGGTIVQKVTKQQRKFFWAMFYKTKNQMWKFAALKNQLKITIPKRQFIGESNELNERIEEFVYNELSERIDKMIDNI